MTSSFEITLQRTRTECWSKKKKNWKSLLSWFPLQLWRAISVSKRSSFLHCKWFFLLLRTRPLLIVRIVVSNFKALLKTVICFYFCLTFCSYLCKLCPFQGRKTLFFPSGNLTWHLAKDVCKNVRLMRTLCWSLTMFIQLNNICC